MNHQNRQNAHHKIGHIFKDLLPAQGMPERPEQIILSRRMLDSKIALCDAGTGIGKRPMSTWWPERCTAVFWLPRAGLASPS